MILAEARHPYTGSLLKQQFHQNITDNLVLNWMERKGMALRPGIPPSDEMVLRWAHAPSEELRRLRR